ncbi:HK97 gp10 family phage protein [Sphingobium yanoikuyae]|uniref:HK97 gp10 family phage protein n=1 Tax=Sphingobium yanoikuyae TaxID=13690 RepID=UPI0026F31FD7|nr:HK97 gp10 family phage protein [Sphingobium yanoikuyae]
MAGWEGVDPAKWAGVSTAGLTALLRNSVQELAKVASTTIPNGGRVPVKTGNLARSVVVDNKPPTVIDVLATQQNFSLGVADIKPGDTVYIGWQAKYARRLNYGFVGADSLGRTYNQSGYGFAEAAAAQWPRIVTEQAKKMGGK